MKNIIFCFIFGGIIASLSCFFLNNYEKNNKQPWKIFSYIWSAPILLFIPLYMSYSVGPEGSVDFLNHVFLGSLATLFVIVITIGLFKLNMNNISVLIINFILSYVVIYIYFKYNFYNRI